MILFKYINEINYVNGQNNQIYMENIFKGIEINKIMLQLCKQILLFSKIA